MKFSKISASLSTIIAPSVYAVGRALRSDTIIECSGRLDPMFIRAHLHKIGEQCGWDLLEAQRFSRVTQLLAAMNFDCSMLVRDSYSNSRSQLLQDLLVVAVTRGKKNGYFVEIGVGDGEMLSNSYLLERQYGWTGILVEPNIMFHDQILAVRTAQLDTRAAYRRSGETADFLINSTSGELSTLRAYDGRDSHMRRGETVHVQTATIEKILAERGAPDVIDYVSIDTEGSEFAVLEGFDFCKRRVSIFTIESNYDTKKMEKIDSLLSYHGYKKVFDEISSFDSWYISCELLQCS